MGLTRSVERMIVRARRVRPNQRLPGSRTSAGTFLLISGSFTGSSRPAWVARQRLAASTVIRRSARVWSPSLRMRSYSSDASPPNRVSFVSVSEANSLNGCSSP